MNRVQKIVLSLAIGIATSIFYYYLTNFLLSIVGQTAYIYGATISGVILYVLREFWPDIKKKVRQRRQPKPKVDKEPEQASDQKEGTQKAETKPSKLTPEEIEALFNNTKARFDRGQMTLEEFQKVIADEFMFVDPQRKFWTMDASTGNWVYSNGKTWVKGIPLDDLVRVTKVAA